MLAGFLVASAILYAAVYQVRREGLRFYDLYVARYGGHPTREELRAERLRSPFSIYARPLRRDRFRVAQVYTPVSDEEVERYRRRTQLALNVTWAALIGFLPISDFVTRVWIGGAFPAGWAFTTAGRTLSLAVLATWWIQLLVASANAPTAWWWRIACIVGMGSGVIGFLVFSLV